MDTLTSPVDIPVSPVDILVSPMDTQAGPVDTPATPASPVDTPGHFNQPSGHSSQPSEHSNQPSEHSNQPSGHQTHSLHWMGQRQTCSVGYNCYITTLILGELCQHVGAPQPLQLRPSSYAPMGPNVRSWAVPAFHWL